VGKLSVAARQLPSGTILVEEPLPEGRTVLYTRVCAANQKEDVERQMQRLVAFARKQGWTHFNGVDEIGSGLNGKRKKLLRVLRDPKVSCIVVGHRDRLLRFGFELIEAALASAGKRVVVLDAGEIVEDLGRDLLEILTSACERLYGRRSAWNRARRAVEAMECE
jgi:putative resolvase